jgi:hypothetical protein
MSIRILLCSVFVCGCVQVPASTCSTVRSERVGSGTILAELDGVSVDQWLEDSQGSFDWDVEWVGLDDALDVDHLSMTLTRRGRPAVEELRPSRSGMPDEFIEECGGGPLVRMGSRVRLEADGEMVGAATGELLLNGAELADARLRIEIPFGDADWLPGVDFEELCEGRTTAWLAFALDSGLEHPHGVLNGRQGNCRATIGEWRSIGE